MAIFKRDVFGHLIFIKRIIFFLVGIISYPRFMWFNKTRITGTEYLKGLPKNQVLFVSNHQTYFADVISLNHVFSSVKWGYKNSIKYPVYLLDPRHNTYYIAAKETMKAGILPKIFEYAGSISINRTWREAGKDVNRKVDLSEISQIGEALTEGWVITFPQGTTTPFVPGRRGTAHIIKKFKPIVVPVVINGYRRAFDKKGLQLKKKGVQLSIRFKPPMDIDYNAPSDQIISEIMFAIEQSEEFQIPGRKQKGNVELTNKEA
ncbi:MAG: 1-acyl-sn-glycerol-3-phosphate acyltransferase [Bacteroidetes bacterium]|nr:1-acyl-sn-glycerol-3-phosphate acyltransferase [Bacteroidota bacterium]